MAQADLHWLPFCGFPLKVHACQLLVREGIRLRDFANSDTRIRHRTMMELLEQALARTGDPLLGLRATEGLDAGDLDVLEYATRNRPSLRDAIVCANRYMHLMHSAQDAQLIEAGERATWEVRVTDDAQLPPLELEAVEGASATKRIVKVDPVNRELILHVPSSLPAGAPVPLVMVHHGFTMSGRVMETLTSWKAVADREKFIVAFPNGDMDLGPISSPWNVGLGVCGVGALVGNLIADDLGFVDAMIANIKSVHPIDQDNIFTTGFSMGGYFANHMGCQRSKLLKAIAPHSGGTYAGSCPADYEPLPVLVMHGTGDGLIAYNCGKQAKDQWIKRNGCSTTVEKTELLKGGKCEYYAGCKPGAEVGMCTFDGMGHGWAGSAGYGLPFDYAGGVRFEDAAEVIWRFYKKYL